MNQSDLDSRYFIDRSIYNCPFCKRNHVKYQVIGTQSFDWTTNKQCRLFIVQCQSCEKRSIHLTYEKVDKVRVVNIGSTFSVASVEMDGRNLDDLFFFQQPTSLFSVDERIPRILRELITEAQGCLNSNFLTGASACVRKVIYELAVLEDAEGGNYEERIKSLKDKDHDVDDVYFDTLLTVQDLTSNKVHENAYDGWESKHLRVLLSALLEVLEQLYVLPKIRQERRQQILEMKQDLIPERADDPKPSQLPAETEQSET